MQSIIVFTDFKPFIIIQILEINIYKPTTLSCTKKHFPSKSNAKKLDKNTLRDIAYKPFLLLFLQNMVHLYNVYWPNISFK